MDAAGDAFSFSQTPDEAADSTNCTVSVPARPLTAQGLATPWELGDGCTWANGATEGVFIDATILAPNGKIQVYNPLVIDQGTQPEAAPAPPTIARGSQVILSVGFNGNALALVGPGVRQGNCMDALGNSLINQTPQCNAASFYRLANAEIARGLLKIPATGTGQDGQACQTTRDFALIDQDQSDNAVAHYLYNPATDQTSQDTAANQASFPGDTVESNGSDNGLLDSFVDPALGCKPFTAPNTTNPNGASAAQALNELSRPAEPEGHRRAAPGQRPATAGRRAVQPGQDQHVPGRDRHAAPARQHQPHPECGPVLPEHGQHRDAQAEAGRRAGTRHPLTGTGPRRQPDHLPGRPAQRLIRQPELQELRADRPRQPHPRRQRRRHRRHLQHRTPENRHSGTNGGGRHGGQGGHGGRGRRPRWPAAGTATRRTGGPTSCPAATATSKQTACDNAA